MSKLNDAADQVIGLADRFRGILELAEAVKGLGSVDQAIVERTAAIEILAASYKQAKDALGSTQASLDTLQQTQADALARHKQDCDAITASARENASDILLQARSEAAAITEQARADSEAAQATHDSLITEKKAELADLQSKIEAATRQLTNITATRDETVQQIEALRAAAKAVLSN